MALSRSEKIPGEDQQSPELVVLLDLMKRLGDPKLFLHVYLYLEGERYFVDLDGVGELNVVALMKTFVDRFLNQELSLEVLAQLEYNLTLIDFLSKE